MLRQKEISVRNIVVVSVIFAFWIFVFSRIPTHFQRWILWGGLAIPLAIIIGIFAKFAWEQHADPAWRIIRALEAEREKRKLKPLKVRAAIVGGIVLVGLAMFLTTAPRAEWLRHIAVVLAVGLAYWIGLWLYTRSVQSAE